MADCQRHLNWFYEQCQKIGVQSAGLTTAPFSGDYGIHPIFDDFYVSLKKFFLERFALPSGDQDPNFVWLSAVGYADDMEFRDQWHFINSEENRNRLSAYWVSTFFALDAASAMARCSEQLASQPRRDWDNLKKNVNFLLEDAPPSYLEKVERATKLIFGTSRKTIPAVGTAFTPEEVRDRQPDTENFQDPDEYEQEWNENQAEIAARKGLLKSSPKAKATDVTTGGVTLKSSAAAASSTAVDMADVTDLPEKQQATASSATQAKVTKYVRPFHLEDHLPEYEYTVVTNANGEDVPGIIFRDVAYELELVTAKDARSWIKGVNVDQKVKLVAFGPQLVAFEPQPAPLPRQAMPLAELHSTIAWQSQRHSYIAPLPTWQCQWHSYIAPLPTWQCQWHSYLAPLPTWQCQWHSYLAPLPTWQCQWVKAN